MEEKGKLMRLAVALTCLFYEERFCEEQMEAGLTKVVDMLKVWRGLAVAGGTSVHRTNVQTATQVGAVNWFVERRPSHVAMLRSVGCRRASVERT
jgi:hypothetical protein